MKNTASPRSPPRRIRSFGTVKRDRSSLATRSSCRVEAGEEIQPLDQAMRVQTDLKAWPPFGSTTAGAASLQVVIELLRDQSFFEQGLVPAHLLP
jgi:hypothetical protein